MFARLKFERECLDIGLTGKCLCGKNCRNNGWHLGRQHLQWAGDTLPVVSGITVLQTRHVTLVVKSYRSCSGSSATISSFVNFLGRSESSRTLGVRLTFMISG